jgi:hypothetical protein
VRCRCRDEVEVSLYQGDPTTNYAYAGLDDNTFDTIGNRYGCYVTFETPVA